MLVGPEEKSFFAHEGIITHHSAFFRAACSGNFKESKERVVRLSTADPGVFQILLHWVYTKALIKLAPDTIDENEDKCGTKRYDVLVETYVLAD